MPIPLVVDQNSFKTVRSNTTVANDSTPGLINLPDLQRFDSQGADRIVFYWHATGAGAVTIDVTIYVLDGLEGRFLVGDKISGLAQDTLAELQCVKASNAVLAVSGLGASVGTAFAIRAVGLTL